MAWVNPNYESLTGRKPPTATESRDDQAAPDDQGQRLVTLPRSSKAGEEELRVSLAEFNGHPYLSLRVWARDAPGQWWPQKSKGCSVRLAEAQDVAEALMTGLRLAGPQEQGAPRSSLKNSERTASATPRAKPRATATRQPTRTQQEFPERAAGGESFDEFG